MARSPRSRSDRWLVFLLSSVLVILLLGTIITGAIVLFGSGKISSGVSPAKSSSGEKMPQIPENSQYQQPLQKSEGPESKKWDGVSRVNILVLGLDSREGEGDVARSDSIMVLTMDPKTKTAGMLSLPRDLWVNIPGNGESKINTAYFLGAAYGADGGGPGLAMRTVGEFLNIPVNYYVLVNWDAFVKFIDAIGGIEVNPKEDIIIDPVGPGNTMQLRAGVQTLDGAAALAYARARNTGQGDMDRAERQQQVIMGVRDNILNYYSITKLIANAPKIYQEAKNGVQTNLSLEEAIRLIWAVKDIPEKKIRKEVIKEPDHATAMLSFNGQYALVPIPEEIAALSRSMFGNNPGGGEDSSSSTAGGTPPSKPVPTQDPKARLEAEGARVLIWNGTRVAGLATRTADYLTSKGFTVIQGENAPELHETTEIRYQVEYPYTLKRLLAYMKLTSIQVYNQNLDSNLGADIVLILGDDWALTNPMP